MSVVERSKERKALRLHNEILEITETLALAESDPRKVETGTSFNAKGSVPTPPGALNELGSSARTKLREVVPELQNRVRELQTYEKMGKDDASVDVSLRSAKVPVLGATYFIEPYDDQEINLQIAEFCEFNLLGGMNQPFILVMEEVLRMFENGYSILEPVWELREWTPKKKNANTRKFTMLKKLGARPANSVKNFLYDDNGGPLGITQMALRASGKVDEVEIPIDKLLIFTFNKNGGNLEGKSLLRTAYKHWYYKTELYKVDAIQKERHALGVPQANLQPGWTDADREAAMKLVQNLRTNEAAGMVLPPMIKVEFAKVEGQLVDVMKSIDHHEGRILLNVMVQFLLLGLQGGGGRATSGAHLDMFQKSLKYVGNLICEYFNLYLIPRMVGYNFDTKAFPKLAVRNIGEGKDMQMWASAMANLASQNLITLDLETEQWVRQQIDAPQKLGGVQTPEANASGSSPFGNDGSNKGGVQTDPGSGTGNTSTDPGAEAVSN